MLSVQLVAVAEVVEAAVMVEEAALVVPQVMVAVPLLMAPLHPLMAVVAATAMDVSCLPSAYAAMLDVTWLLSYLIMALCVHCFL